LFAAFFSSVANAGNMFSSITLSGNTISNLHAVDGGKGLYSIAGTAAFRTSPLIVHASSNTIGQSVYRSGSVSVEGALIGKETAVPAFTVALDSVIPESSEAPSAITVEPTGSYVELNQQPDLAPIQSELLSLDTRIDAAEGLLDGRLDVLEAFAFEKESFTLGVNPTGVTLAHVPKAKSTVMFVGRLALHEGLDYSISGNQVTFTGDFAYNSGDEIAAAVGDVVKVTYYY
jgi:hypothetical protein